MKYSEIIGDLVEESEKYDIVIQGCNCQNRMGAGIALFLKNKYPEIYEADTVAFKNGQVKLGATSEWYNPNINTLFINCYTQFSTAGRFIGKPDVDYTAISNSLRLINSKYPNKSIGVPLIGCGLAGGNWKKVKSIIQKELKDMDVKIVFILKDYLKMKIVEFFESIEINLYLLWMDIDLSIGMEESVYYLNLFKLEKLAKKSSSHFVDDLLIYLNSLNCVEFIEKDSNKFLKIKIHNDFESYYK